MNIYNSVYIVSNTRQEEKPSFHTYNTYCIHTNTIARKGVGRRSTLVNTYLRKESQFEKNQARKLIRQGIKYLIRKAGFHPMSVKKEEKMAVEFTFPY